jgi:putative phosphoribosyl transferase
MQSPRRGVYADREAAGVALAADLRDFADRDDVVVLGLARGGVPVAAQLAEQLHAPLDVLVVRKLGLPGQPELAMGAIAEVGTSVEVVHNAPVLRQSRVTAEEFDEVLRAESAVLHDRVTDLRRDRTAAPVRARTVIVVDDGLATGSTMRAAVAAVRAAEPRHIIVAVPVGSSGSCSDLQKVADEVICSWVPEAFVAVGQAYRDFTQTTDDQVRTALLAQ